MALRPLSALQAELDAKADVGHTHPGGPGAPVTVADVVGLTDALAGKAPTSHEHAQSDIVGLVADLDALEAADAALADALESKADADHTHAGGSSSVEVEIDVGAACRSARVIVPAAGCTPSSLVQCWQSGNAPTGKFADDNELDALLIRVRPGTDAFTAFIDAHHGRIVGKYKLIYRLG